MRAAVLGWGGGLDSQKWLVDMGVGVGGDLSFSKLESGCQLVIDRRRGKLGWWKFAGHLAEGAKMKKVQFRGRVH